MGEVTITLRLTPGRPPRDLLRKLTEEPRDLLTGLARTMTLASRKGFDEQSYGGWRWPEVYEGSGGAFINVAGALVDFNAGADAPRPRQFQRRPALVDKGELRASVHTRTTGPLALEQWSTRSDARAHMDGQPVVIPVTEQAKRGIASWLFEQGNTDYTPKLNHLLRKSQYIVKLHARPFMGVHDELRADMEQQIAEYYGGRIKAAFEGRE